MRLQRLPRSSAPPAASPAAPGAARGALSNTLLARRLARAPRWPPEIDPQGTPEAKAKHAELFGTLGHGVGAHRLAANLKTTLLASPDSAHHEAAADLLDNYWIRDIYDATLELSGAQLALLRAASSARNRRARVGVCVEKRLDPNFALDPYLAQHPEISDPAFIKALKEQFGEVTARATQELAGRWTDVFLGPGAATATAEAKAAAVQRVVAARGAVTPTEGWVDVVPGAANAPKSATQRGYQYGGITPRPERASAGTETLDARLARLSRQELGSGEGNVDAINTYDSQIFNVAGGFGVKQGGGSSVLTKFLAAVPLAAQRLLEVGFKWEPGGAVLLDVSNPSAPVVRRGADALTAITRDLAILRVVAYEMGAQGQAQDAFAAVDATTAQQYSILPANATEADRAKLAGWSDDALAFAIHSRLFAPALIPPATILAEGPTAAKLLKVAMGVVGARERPVVALPGGGQVTVFTDENTRILGWGHQFARGATAAIPADQAKALTALRNGAGLTEAQQTLVNGLAGATVLAIPGGYLKPTS